MKFFNINEFACKCCGCADMQQDLLDRIDRARERAGVPFVITSGYRCPVHNKKVGGIK